MVFPLIYFGAPVSWRCDSSNVLILHRGATCHRSERRVEVLLRLINKCRALLGFVLLCGGNQTNGTLCGFVSILDFPFHSPRRYPQTRTPISCARSTARVRFNISISPERVALNIALWFKKGNLLGTSWYYVDGRIPHHFESIGNHGLLVFTGEPAFQGFLGGAGFRPSTVLKARV